MGNVLYFRTRQLHGGVKDGVIVHTPEDFAIFGGKTLFSDQEEDIRQHCSQLTVVMVELSK
jgi:hypothetical protein